MSLACPPKVVLDTNAVLDWLVFRDPRCARWTSWLAEGRARWVSNAATRAECWHVLQRGVAAQHAPSLDLLAQIWCRLAVDGLDTAAPLSRARCTDPDDQKFVDLAVQAQARWLVSRDKAVLKLRRRLVHHGVEVLTPQAWSEALAAECAVP